MSNRDLQAFAEALLPDVWRGHPVAYAFRRAFQTQQRKDRFQHGLKVPISHDGKHTLYLDYSTKPANYVVDQQEARDQADELKSQEEHRDIGWGA